MDKISVIVPVYNVEKYLNRCVESIVNQTYTNLEIILVDDGSSDNSPQICDEWANKDNRIKVIHNENGGISAARNAGLSKMSGEYVYFIDSDDYIKNYAIKTLYDIAIENDADMSFGRYIKFDDSSVINSVDFSNKSYCLTEDEYWEKHYLPINNDIDYSVNMIVSWNKLIKRFVFSSLQFDEGKTHEDEYIIHKIISKCSKIAYVDKGLYYYYQNINGIMHSKKATDSIYSIEALSKRTIYFADKNKEYTSNCFGTLFYVFRWSYFSLDKKQKAEAKCLYKNAYNHSKKFLKDETLKNRLLYKSFCIGGFAFRIANKLVNIL